MKLNLLFINDVQGYLAPHPELFYDETGEVVETAGGYAHIAGLVEDIRRKNPNTLLLDGGDTLHGTKPLVDSKGEAIIPILNALKPDALVGHWDFGYGPEQLQKINKALNFPILGCNVFAENGFNFLQKEDVKIGVIGICAMIVDKVMPEKMSEGLKFTTGIDELPKYIKQLKKEGADIIVLLSHNGFPQDVELLKKVDGIDICLSAHTHNRLYAPIEVNGARIVQCGCQGVFVGNFTIVFEENKIKNYDYELIKVDNSVPKNTEMDKLVQKALKPYQEISTTALGHTKEILHRYNTTNSTMDNLLLKAIAHITKTDIAFSNGWRYGAPIAVGKITENDLYNIAPMNPPVSTVELTGIEIKEMLEENLERTFCSNPLKQMGGYAKRVLGLQINMRIENPKGHRIQEIYYKGSHLNLDKTYKVSFVTMQGVSKKYGKNRKKHNQKAVEAMKTYLKENPEFSPDTIKSFRLV
ncbi:bifunctional metallophosphatase/5'-nucleotidase [Zunongwangia profunda]|jgi:5'-nucleotidase|uniref:bifunctional metallophosphatase/5'-nucleotidase n=2 Tax=Zunongwangia profunda TaxID=398743 RepID=UPI000C9801EA|nr:bifunctional metallophosphatase/5'-nucleotidase [Zunongwangia profunda]MAG86499.1 bifunctional metallophosphatase/5'-nucleotidase [Flavobacteriaceae bacterium]MCC4227738.1 bifunctional metallophosphatase/5'-nucleotidase [Zunongwangia profunda]|tara:strand:- start:8170 stop:9579 length:1410 start_codon:yes stop_codon:yes gene_type:complete